MARGYLIVITQINPSIVLFSWVEDVPVAKRLIDIWPKIVEFWEKLPKSKRPNNKSYEVVLKARNYPLTVVKLKFFTFIAEKLKGFLTIYQK